MKHRFTLVLLISMISAGIFGQVYTDFTPPLKPQHPEREFSYHELLETYKAIERNTLRKSLTDISTYLDTAQIQFYLGDDQYLPIRNQIIIYDISGRPTSMRIIELNSQTFQWENSLKTENSYDIKGNISQVIREEWDVGSSEWAPTSKTEYSYDESNNLVSILDYEWSQSVSLYLNSRKIAMSHDENGLETQSIVSFWDADQGLWLEAWKYEYSYNTDNALLLETEYEWDDDASDWILSWKTDYYYDENKNLSAKEEFIWDIPTSLWISDWESILTYDPDGNISEQIDSEYLLPEGTWQEQYKGEYTFDEQNNPLTEMYSQWDENTTQLTPRAKYEYVYDQGILLSELVAPPINWFVPDYREQILSKPLGYVSYEYNADTPAFEVYYQEVYFYNEHYPTHTIGSETSHIASVFPNPASEYITINFAGEDPQVTFELFDVTGRRVIFRQLENGERLNIEGFQNGIYFYRITGNEQIQRGKILIK